MKFSGKFSSCLFITETKYGIRFADDLYYQTNYSNVWLYKDYENYITKRINKDILNNVLAIKLLKGLEAQI